MGDMPEQRDGKGRSEAPKKTPLEIVAQEVVGWSEILQDGRLEERSIHHRFHDKEEYFTPVEWMRRTIDKRAQTHPNESRVEQIFNGIQMSELGYNIEQWASYFVVQGDDVLKGMDDRQKSDLLHWALEDRIDFLRREKSNVEETVGTRDRKATYEVEKFPFPQSHKDRLQYHIAVLQSEIEKREALQKILSEGVVHSGLTE